MKYPFNFKLQDAPNLIFTAKDVDGNLVVTWNDNGVEQTNTLLSLERVQEYIDDGLWIVQELEFPFNFRTSGDGETLYTATLADGKPLVSWGSVDDRDSYDGYNLAEVKRHIQNGAWIVQKPVEAPTGASVEVSGFAIKVESKEAVAAVKELTEAINELGYAYGKLIEIQKRFKGSV